MTKIAKVGQRWRRKAATGVIGEVRYKASDATRYEMLIVSINRHEHIGGWCVGDTTSVLLENVSSEWDYLEGQDSPTES